jgi:hypothetical protein
MIMRIRISPRAAMALSVVAALAGCSSAPSYIAQADITQSIGPTSQVQPARGADFSLALAQMPEPGGTVTDIREQFYSNGVRQEISLGGSVASFGQNKLTVAVQTASSTTGAKNLQIWRPAEAGIKQEILARYPQLDMQILTQPRHNALGTFGLAIGRNANGVRCIFAWQWIDDINNPGASSTLSQLGSLGSSAQPVSLRINLCRKDATVDDLAMAAEGLALAPRAIVDRILDPGRRSYAAGPTIPAASGIDAGAMAANIGDGTLEGALSAPVRPRAEVAAAPHRAKVARRARSRRAPDDGMAVQQAAVPLYQSGPRYMAPVAGVAQIAASPYATSPYGATSRPQTRGLDPSLPAAAYRGPSGQRYLGQ